MKILTYIELYEGILKKSDIELLSYANALRNIIKGEITAFTGTEPDEKTIALIARYGANRILFVPGEKNHYSELIIKADIIRQAAKKEESEIILFTSSIAGKSLAPLVSAKLKAGMLSGVYSLPVNLDPFTIKRKIFSGKAIASVTIKTRYKVLLLLPNTFPIKEYPVSTEKIEFIPVVSTPSRTDIKGIRILDTVKTNDTVKLGEAEVVVSGGRGISSRENWKYVDELATLLGGATACSKPAFDEGWCPHDGYVGQTGKTVSPNIYLALGISGATQHLAGIRSSKLIVAINKDPEALIFKSADYGIVGDINDVIPILINAIKDLKKNNSMSEKK